MGSVHTAFGLRIRSNLSIPGLVPLEDSGEAADLGIQVGLSPYSQHKIPTGGEELAYESPYTDEAGMPALRIWKSPDGGYLRLAYFDGTQFWLEQRGKEVWVVWPETSTLEDACSYLLGPVLGILLRLRGITCLHSSAVALDGQAVAFVGAEGAGKSTTAAAFACQGNSVLSDDVVALTEAQGEFFVLPAYPHLCLWPESVAMLYGSPDALPPFSKGWEKQRLSLSDRETRFENRPLPLRAIYLLGERVDESGPRVEVTEPRSALLSLVTDSFATRTLDRETRAREFELLGRLVTTVPVRRLIPHRDGAQLFELCRIIREDFASLEPRKN